MKKWKKPVVTRVKLDPKQAVMQVCAQNMGFGAWMDGGGSNCSWGTAPLTNGGFTCATGARGTIDNIYYADTADPQNAGS